jgi:dTDP-4-amino-4,6-dideoxygalactose transaminase
LSTSDSQIRVPLFVPDFDGSEKRRVAAAIDSGWIAMGPLCAEFEQKFAARLGVRHAISVTNCTAALHLAYVCCDIGPGDEVVVPSLTFAATANAVAYTGATPVFADIVGEEDWTLDPASIASAITPRTKAISAMHYGGYPCDMRAILGLADRHGLAVIEDACHGLGGTVDGKAMGTLGRAGCFSFYSNKAITTGEGGMIVTDDDRIAERCRRLRSHGMTALAYDRMKGAMGYDIDELGFNYRLDDIRAAFGLAQFERLDSFVARRRELAAHYRARLADIAGVTFPAHGGRGEPANYILPVILDPVHSRDAVRHAMLRSGVQTSVHYLPVHGFSHYAADAARLPRTEALAGQILTLPLYPSLTFAQVDMVCETLAGALRGHNQAVG